MTYKQWNTGDVLSASALNAAADQLVFRFADATARDAAITSPVDGHVCWLEGTNELQVYAGAAWVTVSDPDVLTVDSANARVGIGTTSPSQELDVAGSIVIPVGNGVMFDRSGTDLDVLFKETPTSTTYATGDDVVLRNPNGADIRFQTNGTNDRMTIDSAGNVGIGTTSPETPLSIVTTNKLGATFTGTTDGEGLRVDQSNYTSGNYVSLVEASYQDDQTAPHVRIGAMFDGGGSNLAIGTSNSYGSGITNTAMFVDSSGNVGIGSTNPDSNLQISGASTLKIRVDDATYVQIANRSSSNDILELTSYGSMEFAIDSNGNSSSKNFTWRDGGEHGAGTALMTLTDGGLLGIGETSPTRRLHANTYVSAGRSYPLAVTNGFPGGGGVLNTEAAIWFATSSSTATSRGAYISAINTGGGSNGHDLIFAVSANTQFPSEGMRLEKNKQLIHHRSGAFCGGPSSWAGGYKNNWSIARSRGTFLTAGSTGITVNRNGFYYVRYVQRHNGTGNPYAGIGENGNRSTLETRTTGMWTHDHGAGANQFLESVYIGYLNSGELLTAGAVNSGNAAQLVFASSGYAGILYAFYLGE